jgi:ABC-type uncharacterized transport system involved in gliding motility auxiliary subunit
MEKLLKYIKPLFNKQYVGYTGLAGLICLLISGVAWILQMRFGPFSAVFSIVGLICVLLYIIIDFKHVQMQFSKRSVKYGTNVTVMILIVLGIAILVEGISSQHNFQIDLTENKRFTLSDQTKKVLKSLDKDVKLTAFFSLEQGSPQALENVLRQYRSISSKLDYEFVDPVKNPGRAKTYEIKSFGTIVLETAEKQEKINDSTEEALTNALVKLTREGKKTVYFLKGHGEHSLDDVGEKGYNQVKKAVEDENYEVKELLLMQEGSVPGDATVLVVAGPEKDLVPAEIETLKQYIQKGGKVLFLVDPDQAPEMTTFLKEYGVLLGNDMIIDPFSRIFGAGYDMPVASAYQTHPITENFSVATFFPVARSIQIAQELPDGVSGVTLASSSPQSWGETNKEELQQGAVEFNDGSDLAGPVPLMAVVTREVSEVSETVESEDSGESAPPQPKNARLVVFGDSDFISNTYFGLSGNSDLFLNTVSWLAEEEDLIAIRARDTASSPLMLGAGQGRFVFFLSLILLPAAVAGFGIMVFVKRRETTR